MKNLYRFYWDCNRAGEIESLFFATEEEIAKLMDQTIILGEVLGKHSEVYGTVEEGDIEKIDLSKQTLKELYSVFGTNVNGYNPLDYLPEEEEDEE